MKIEVKLTGKDEAYIIKNLYPLYLYDLSGHYGRFPNVHGIYEESNDYKTLNDQYDLQSSWWEKPNCLYPFLILLNGIPAGFDLIATPPHCTKGIDYFVNEFFLLKTFRGNGVAEYAAIQVFDKLKGNWELFTNPSEKNIAGHKFWRETVSNYTRGNYEETFGTTFDGDKLIFRFNNE